MCGYCQSVGCHPLGSSLSRINPSIELGSDLEATGTEEFAAVTGGLAAGHVELHQHRAHSGSKMELGT